MPTVWSWKNEFYQTLGAGNTAPEDLFHAATIGDAEAVERLIRGHTGINRKDESGWTALMFAAFNHQIRAMRLLIESGADLDEKNHKGETALILCVITAHRHIMPWTRADQAEGVRMLIDSGANVSVKDLSGRTAIEWARANRLKTALEILKAVEDGTDSMSNKG
jgi:ankyrin repeat protein